MLVAGATLSLIAPIAAQASDINIEGMNTYVRKKSSSKKQKQFNSNSFNNELAIVEDNLQGSDIKFKEFEASTFSDTTTAAFTTSFQMGKTDNSPISDALSANYAYTIDLNTGFTGSDNLYVGIEAGNNDFTSNDFATDSKVSTGDALTVHSMYYSFPLGNFDLAVGNLLDLSLIHI